jgi:hypothetical protein
MKGDALPGLLGRLASDSTDDEPGGLIYRQLNTLRDMPGQQYGLRALVGILALAAMAVAVSWGDPKMIAPGVIALVGIPIAVIAPRKLGSIVVLVAAVVAWFIRFHSADNQPIARVVALAALLYLLHSTATLAASMPVTARFDRAVLRRWYAHAVLTLAIFGVVVLVVDNLAHLAGSRPLEYLGLAAILVPVAVLAVLAHDRAGPEDPGE